MKQPIKQFAVVLEVNESNLVKKVNVPVSVEILRLRLRGKKLELKDMKKHII